MTGPRTQTSTARPPSGWRSPAGWLALLICVTLAAVVASVRPDLGDQRYNIVAAGDDGWGRTAAFDSRVDAAQVGTEVIARDGGEPLATPHRWVVVRYTVAAHRDRLWSNAVSLNTADGYRYHPRAEFSGASSTPVDAGFSARVTVVFEVPAEAVDGAWVQVGPLHSQRRLWDVAVRHDLGAPAEVSEPITLDEPTVQVTG